MTKGAFAVTRRGKVSRRLTMASVLIFALVGCGSRSAPGGPARPAPVSSTAGDSVVDAPPTTAALQGNLVATAVVPSVAVYDFPDQVEPTRAALPNPRPSGGAPGMMVPLVLLVVEQQAEWLKVLLPIRPNGSSGWIRQSEVELARHDYRMLVELGGHRITVWKGEKVLFEGPVGVGKAATRTSTGLFYTTELFDVHPSQQDAYGPYAYGLSGYSEVYYTFGGGDGVLGIHGTGDPSGLGKDVSNGCIRLSNEVITQLAQTLPLGVPVEIRDT